MTTAADAKPESRAFEADVSRLLHLMVHSVYSDKDVFLRELISNAADACERLRYEAIAAPALLGDDAKTRITIAIDAEAKRLTVEDNGIGMSRDEMVEALGTIARSGTKAFMERIEAQQGRRKRHPDRPVRRRLLLGLHGRRQGRRRLAPRRQRRGLALVVRRQGHLHGRARRRRRSAGPRHPRHAASDGGRQGLHRALQDRAHRQGQFRPRPGADRRSWKSPARSPPNSPTARRSGPSRESEIKPEEYTDFYRNFGAFDEPALTVHFRAEGRHEFTALAFVPSARPFDLYDAERKGRMKLYVKRVFITDDAEILPRYLRFVRGLVDSADLPLSLSREMIQHSPILAAIKKSVTGRVLGDLEKLADSDAEAYGKIWDVFGAVIKEGIYEDFERRDALLKLARFRTTASAESRRSLKDYVAALKPNQTAIYYIAGDDPRPARILAPPRRLPRPRHRGAAALRHGRQHVDQLGAVVRRQEVQVGDAGRGGPGGDPAARRQGRGQARSRRNRHQLHRLREVDARRRGVGRPRVRPPHRQRGVSRRLRARPGPLARKAAGRLGPGRCRWPSRSSKSIRATNSSRRWPALGDDEEAFKEDAAHLLYDEARVLDGERPSDAKSFSSRLARLITRGLRKGQDADS